MKCRISLLAIAAPAMLFASAKQPIMSVGELAKALTSTTRRTDAFSVSGTVLYASAIYTNNLALADASGAVVLTGEDFNGIRSGDTIIANGRVQNTLAPGHVAYCHGIRVLGHGRSPDIQTVSGSDLASGRYDNRVIRLSGIIRDAFRDEVDSAFDCLSLNCDGTFVSAFVQHNGNSGHNALEDLIGNEILITGTCLPFSHGARFHIGRIVQTEECRIRSQTDAERFSVPELDISPTFGAEDIARLGPRRMAGVVEAIWSQNKILVRSPSGGIVSADIVSNRLPPVGASVEVVGFPVSNLFAINLTRARWRTTSRQTVSEKIPERMTVGTAFIDYRGRSGIHPRLHGKLVTTTGRVMRLPRNASDKGILFIESDSRLLPVDTSACPAVVNCLEVGYDIEITGITVLNAEEWGLGQVLPRAEGYTLVPRNQSDIHVVSRPSWWTPRRLTVLIAALLLALFAILIWNFLLQRLSDRKGRALAKARLANSESQLKVQERTRLATELHDTIVQNLTGASMELRTANRTYDSDRKTSLQQLSLAIKTLDSCRNEIRNCIWDLRSRALDENSMDTAIRRTVAPFSEDVNLAIRFAVPRKRLTDNTAHALISIVRELVINAIRHGKATSIRIAGCIEDEKLLFSVQDNGSGFDAKTAPGIGQGHFGLQGIHERIDALRGTMSVNSAIGKGTRVSFEVSLVSEGKN